MMMPDGQDKPYVDMTTHGCRRFDGQKEMQEVSSSERMPSVEKPSLLTFNHRATISDVAGRTRRYRIGKILAARGHGVTVIAATEGSGMA